MKTKRKTQLLTEVENEARKNLAGRRPRPDDLGYCHAFWGEKQRILKDKYCIDWQTPTERSPHILFD